MKFWSKKFKRNLNNQERIISVLRFFAVVRVVLIERNSTVNLIRSLSLFYKKDQDQIEIQR